MTASRSARRTSVRRPSLTTGRSPRASKALTYLTEICSVSAVSLTSSNGRRGFSWVSFCVFDSLMLIPVLSQACAGRWFRICAGWSSICAPRSRGSCALVRHPAHCPATAGRERRPLRRSWRSMFLGACLLTTACRPTRKRRQIRSSCLFPSAFACHSPAAAVCHVPGRSRRCAT